MRRAKIVCTLGPSAESLEQIAALAEAGMNVARLNLSHGAYEEHEGRFRNVRQVAKQTGDAIGILVDLQGPKIRLGTFAKGKEFLENGAEFTITVEDVPGDSTICSTTYKGLPGDCTPGDSILVDDGKLHLEVVKVDATSVTTRVVEGGPISNSKGLNLPGVAVSVPAMSEKDEMDLRWALGHPAPGHGSPGHRADMIALSFVRDAVDIDRVHAIMDEVGVRLPVIAKIEKPQAVANLDAIVDAFDAIMVARGDLGVELPLEQVPMVQKRCVTLARRNAKPVIVATQMLESMITNSRPTRAEASDVANAVLDGTDAVMLSGRDLGRRLRRGRGRGHGPHHRRGRGGDPGRRPEAGPVQAAHQGRRRRPRGGRAGREPVRQVPGRLHRERRHRPAAVALPSADAGDRVHPARGDAQPARPELGRAAPSAAPRSSTPTTWSARSTASWSGWSCARAATPW